MIKLAQGKSLDYISYQNIINENDSAQKDLEFLLEENSHLKILVVSADGKLNVQNLTVHLKGKNAKVEIYGYAYVRTHSQVRHRTSVIHYVPNTYSEQKFIHIARKNATVSFEGHIRVEKNAINIEANQFNKNLMLEELAHIKTRPQLEVYADDVKCTHGASVGSLADDQLYYLQSRGIPVAKAKKLLQYGYLNEILKPFQAQDIKHIRVEDLLC